MIIKSHETAKKKPRVAVIHVEFPPMKDEPESERARDLLRGSQAKLEEAVNLTQALAVDLIHSEMIALKKVNPKLVIGSGYAQELLELWDKEEIDLVVMNCPLTPSQQRNLENMWQVKVIDRTHLILEIFADRAQTKAGRLQVALAQQKYQKGRLVRAWTHLERQRGGMGKTGGPGERQIELDKRMIRDRIRKIEEDLSRVEKERLLQRAGRTKSGLPVVSLVGYTNAGKSSLFNAVLKSTLPKGEETVDVKEEAMVKDMLFATLDPLMRKVTLPSGREFILSDTVGFISDLPHELVASFKSTLEEVMFSDLLLHVHDASSADALAQAEDVREVLGSIEAGKVPSLNVFNKMDLPLEDEGADIHNAIEGIDVSALQGEGVEALLEAIETKLSEREVTKDIMLFTGDGKRLAWLHAHAQVLSTDYSHEGKVSVSVKIAPETLEQFSKI